MPNNNNPEQNKTNTGDVAKRATYCLFGAVYGALYIAADTTFPPLGVAMVGGLLGSGVSQFMYLNKHAGPGFSPKEENNKAITGFACGAVVGIMPTKSPV